MPGREDPEIGGARDKTNIQYNSTAAATTTTPSSSYLEELSERHWTSWLVPMFVVANVVMFIVEMFVNNCPERKDDCFLMLFGKFSFQPLQENPLFGPSSTTLEKMGALEWSKIVYDHQGWRLLTCIWLHAGVVHLLANMLSLVAVGIRLEQQFGFVRIGIIYFLSGFGGSVLSCLFIRNNISLGASGAVFGLLGAMLSELITNWTLYKDKAGAVLTLLIIVAINLAIGILPHVDNFSHIGGFLTGFLLGFVLLPRPRFGWTRRPDLHSGVRLNSSYDPYQYVMWLLSLIMLIAGFVVALMMLFRGENGNAHCSWCHYLSCIPTSRWNCGERQ